MMAPMILNEIGKKKKRKRLESIMNVCSIDMCIKGEWEVSVDHDGYTKNKYSSTTNDAKHYHELLNLSLSVKGGSVSQTHIIEWQPYGLMFSMSLFS